MNQTYCLLILAQEPSVALALQILDGSPLRPGDKIPMSVTPAKFEQKGKIHSWYLWLRPIRLLDGPFLSIWPTVEETCILIWLGNLFWTFGK